MADETLNVLLADNHAGAITRRRGGKHSFEYLKSWQDNAKAIPLSYSIPLQQDRHGTHTYALSSGWRRVI
jgi:HipA-like protein